MLTDTHTHLYWKEYEQDLDAVINRAKEADVTTIINIGVSIETSTQALKQAKHLTSPNFNAYSSIGIHPHEAHQYQDDAKLVEDIYLLEQIYHSNNNKVVLVGECGLDFFFEGNRDFIPSGLTDEILKNLQRKIFQAQIDLARKLNLPLSVHCRDDRSKNPQNIDCWEEILEMVKSSKGILHCYSGPSEITQKAQKLNFLISFAGNITYSKNEYLRQAVTELPLEKIILETDCPFLAPQSHRGTRNEPNAIREIAYLIAEIKGLPFARVAHQTTQNAKHLLGI